LMYTAFMEGTIITNCSTCMCSANNYMYPFFIPSVALTMVDSSLGATDLTSTRDRAFSLKRSTPCSFRVWN
jgi:hypothetical protein